MNSSGLLDLSYLLMCPALNFSSQMTCLSGGARAWKLPLPDGVTSLDGEHRVEVGDVSLRCLWSSMMLRKLSQSQSYSHIWRCWVIHRCMLLSARWRLLLTGDAIHFRLASPDRSIGCRQKVLLEGCRPITLLWHSLPPQPLVCQSDKGRAFRCHMLNWLHNSLEWHGVEVQI
jgi:hypothetical protein